MTEFAPESVQKAAAATDGSVGLAAEPLAADICVIGAGAGGLAVASLAAAFGRKVILVEKHRTSGSTSGGSIPSKAFIATARRADAMRHATEFGIASVEPQIDFRAVQNHIRGVISEIAPNESLERFAGLGIRIVVGGARFLDSRTVLAGDYRITARRFVIATGSAPAAASIPGLDRTPYFTATTIFENDRKISHLVVIGGGPVGLELAQAYARLGSRVTVIEAARALGREDPEATAVVLQALRNEGIDIREGSKAENVESMAGFVRVHISTVHGADTIDGSHVLFAGGRSPNVSDLNLEAAGVKYTRDGIVVNRGLRTSNRRIYAMGDVTGGPAASHVATYQAEVVLRRTLFRLPAKVDTAIIPWVTFTDPELAHVGLSEAEARAAKYKINVLRWPFSENDRAIAEHRTRGHVKIVTSHAGRILGATIVGPQASELIQMWALAVAQKLDIKAMTGYVAPYPTFGEVGKRAAIRQYQAEPAKPKVRKLIDFLARLG
jgi:pyruvate/2-oxoglutarate dehydrogenase complex dihydrolipoamide dehydrogenase (E3) component